jgi:phage tail protein X
MKTYITVQGDTWDMIAYKMYRDEYQIDKLIEANTKHISTVIFSAGTVLNVPDIEPSSTAEKPPWMR